MLRKTNRDFLTSQLELVKETWIQSLEIKERESNLRRTVNLGDGIINERFNFLMKSGKSFTREEASIEIDLLFNEEKYKIEKNIHCT